MIQKKMKRIVLLVASTLVLTQATPSTMPFSHTTVAEAATVKLNTTKKVLLVSQTYTLKVKGTSKKVKWSSSKKTVATVTSKGKVTAKKAGKAVISAKVAGKTYKCTITVSNDKYLIKAPFTGKRTTFGTCSVVIPKAWQTSTTASGDITVYIITPSKTQNNPNITVNQIALPGASNDDYESYKNLLTLQTTEEALEQQFNAMYSTESTDVTNLTFADKTYDCGKVVVMSYNVEFEGYSLYQEIYTLFAKDTMTQLNVTKNADSSLSPSTPEVETVADYMMKSLKLKS